MKKSYLLHALAGNLSHNYRLDIKEGTFLAFFKIIPNMILKFMRMYERKEDMIKHFKLTRMLFGHAAYMFDLRN